MRYPGRAPRVLPLVSWLIAFGAACSLAVPSAEELDFSCHNDSDCAAGFTCVDARCVSGGDVDRDAAQVHDDASAPDLLSPDLAAPDAAAPDLAASDSSAVDAGVTDATAVDATAVDATAADASSADDAGQTCPQDAGSYDTPIAFTPELQVYAVDGPFNTGVLAQGSPPSWSCVRGDAIVISPGDRIGGELYSHFDPGQGSLVFWASPDWDIAELVDDSRVLFRAGDFTLGVDGPSLGAYVQVNATTRVTFDGALDNWTPLSSHMVVLRWDSRSSFAGGHVALVVDDRLYQGVAQPFTPAPGGAELVVGAADASGEGASGVFISGLTVYRRPLFNAEGGVRAQHDDEIAAIYDGGTGRDPSLVTGSWDVVFALPTDATSGAFRLPTGEAWSHPHAQSLLGEEGFLLGALAEGWEVRGGAPSLTAPAPAETIFGGGVKIAGEASDGLRRDFAVSPDTAVVVRALVHSDGVARPRMWLRDNVGDVTLVNVTGSAGSTRDQPDVLIATAQVPSGLDYLRLELLNSAGEAGSFVVHQVEVYENLLDDPSLEDGQGDPYIPDGWTNEDLESGETWRETSEVHSGQASFGIDAAYSATGFHHIRQPPAEFDQLGHFYAAGGHFWWISGDAPRIGVSNGCLMAQTEMSDQQAKFSLSGLEVAGVWQHLSGVGRRHDRFVDDGVDCQNDLLRWGGTWQDSIHVLIDDAYVIHLEQPELLLAPAGLAASTHDGLVRVDRRDLATQPVTEISATSGTISVRLAYPYSVEERPLHCWTNGMLFTLYASPGNFINVRYGPDGPRMEAEFGGDRKDYTFQGPDPLADGLAHDVVVSYASGADAVLLVDGDELFSMDMHGASFGLVPDTLTYGVSDDDRRRCDLLVDVHGALFAP